MGRKGLSPRTLRDGEGPLWSRWPPHCPHPISRNWAGDCGLDPGHCCIPTTCGTAALGARECPRETPSCASLGAWWPQGCKAEAEPSPPFRGVLWWAPCLAAIHWGREESGLKTSLPLQISCSTGCRASPSPPASPWTSHITPAPGWAVKSGPGAVPL